MKLNKIKVALFHKFEGCTYVEHVHCLLYWLTCLCYRLGVHNLPAKTQDVLRCPLNAVGSDDDDDEKSKVYASFLTNVSEFKRLNQLPVPLSEIWRRHGCEKPCNTSSQVTQILLSK